MKAKILLFIWCFTGLVWGQENWRPFNLDSVKRNEKAVLSVLQRANDTEINSFLKKRKRAVRLSYVGLFSVPLIISGGVSLMNADGVVSPEIKTKEQFRLRDAGRFLLCLAGLSAAIKIKCDSDRKKHYRKAMEKYILLNN